ncbi:MAG TPA: hypothetical protein PLD59_11270 [Tepidisphaeraceae bacterium]|nr:hypothetical protein [Tepidisphaeraceae bacterium]
MTRDTKRSGFSLLIVGSLGVMFFWATDPRFGMFASEATGSPADAIRDAAVGTYVGLVGSGIVVLIGLWLLAKRAA